MAGIDASDTFHIAADEIERCVTKLGFRAVCDEPGRAQGHLLNDRRLYPIYEQCQAMGAPIILQTSGTLGGRLIDFANPRHVEEVVDDFLKLHVVCGHGCCPFVLEAIVMASRRNGEILIHQCNGRFTGATAARHILGFDEAGMVLQDWLGPPLPECEAAGHGVVSYPFARAIEPREVDQLRRVGFWERRDPRPQ